MLAVVAKQLKTSLVLLTLFIILTGLIYPGFVMVFAQLFFTKEANGSIITRNGIAIGSVYIGQAFSDPKYFWSRPSATSPFPYNAANSVGSNLGPSNPKLVASIQAKIKQLVTNQASGEIPVDLVTSSGSGLDPEISPHAAFFQVPRIAKIREIPEKDLMRLIKTQIKKRTFNLLGEPRINVLQLNLALDSLTLTRTHHGWKSFNP
jgi:K+-transporting ATPase ATPase C chain